MESTASISATFSHFAALFHAVEPTALNSGIESGWTRREPGPRYSGLCDSRICLSSACMDTTRLKYRSDSSAESAGSFNWP